MSATAADLKLQLGQVSDSLDSLGGLIDQASEAVRDWAGSDFEQYQRKMPLTFDKAVVEVAANIYARRKARSGNGSYNAADGATMQVYFPSDVLRPAREYLGSASFRSGGFA